MSSSKCAEVVGFERRNGIDEVRVDMGGKDVVTAEHYADAGSDCPPLVGDFAAIEDSSGTGTKQAVGYTDALNEGVAEPGEKRFYSRDTDGNIKATAWLKGDGTIVIENANATFSLALDGILTMTVPKLVIESDDIRLGNEAGQPVACIGDLVAGATPPLTSATGGPVTPLPPFTTAVTAAGGILFTAQIISGSNIAKAARS